MNLSPRAAIWTTQCHTKRNTGYSRIGKVMDSAKSNLNSNMRSSSNCINSITLICSSWIWNRKEFFLIPFRSSGISTNNSSSTNNNNCTNNNNSNSNNLNKCSSQNLMLRLHRDSKHVYDDCRTFLSFPLTPSLPPPATAPLPLPFLSLSTIQ